MLERRRLAIAGAGADGYEIRDADTGEAVGSAVETGAAFRRALRRVLGRWIPTTIEVHEKPDDSHVFTLRRGWGLSRARVSVDDSVGQLVGWSRGGSLRDRVGKCLARVRADRSDCQFVTGDGETELGRVTTDAAGSSVVEFGPELAGEPLVKMLILAAVLAAQTGRERTRLTAGRAD
jgi:hypothetical protein